MATTIRRPAPAAPRPTGIAAKLAQWATIRAEIDALTARANHLRDELSQIVDTQGEPDDKGHIYLQLPAPITVGEKTYGSIKRERRVSTVFKEDEAEEALLAKGLLARAQETITVLSQDAIYLLNQEGLLSDEEIDSFFGKKVSFAFKPVAD